METKGFVIIFLPSVPQHHVNNPLRSAHATEHTKTGTLIKNQIHAKDSFMAVVKETKIVTQPNILVTITVKLRVHIKVS